MMINAIHLYSNGIKYAEFSLDQTDHSQRYIIQKSTGFDADDIVPQFYSTSAGSTIPRKKFFNQKLQPRTIAMKIKLNPMYSLNETPSSLRDVLYKTIASNRTGLVELRMMLNATTVAVISGFVVKFEADLFTANPEVTMSVRCDDPFFRSAATIPITLPGSPNTLVIQDDISTAPHGFKFRLTFTSNCNLFVIQSPDGEEKFSIDAPLLNGDVLWFSSEYEDQYLYIVRASTAVQITNTVVPNSVWPLIFPLTNTFNVVAAGVTFNWNSISHKSAFWGV